MPVLESANQLEMVMMDITVIAISCEGDVGVFLLEAALLNSIWNKNIW